MLAVDAIIAAPHLGRSGTHAFSHASPQCSLILPLCQVAAGRPVTVVPLFSQTASGS